MIEIAFANFPILLRTPTGISSQDPKRCDSISSGMGPRPQARAPRQVGALLQPLVEPEQARDLALAADLPPRSVEPRPLVGRRQPRLEPGPGRRQELRRHRHRL